jgi:hypothetical protein
VALGAVEAPEKIEVPPRAAELAVGDGLQADLLLLLDDPLDLAPASTMRDAGGYRRGRHGTGPWFVSWFHSRTYVANSEWRIANG